MSLESILSRLTKVKGRNGSYTACCPAHEDSSPSLAIRDDQGKVLLHCFGGCSVDEVLGAIGLDMTDLFPPKVEGYEPQPKSKFYATDVLKLIAFEASVVMVCAFDMKKGKPLSAADQARLEKAYARINDALEVTQ